MRDIGCYSYQKKAKNTEPRECNSFLGKNRVTMLQIVAKSGETVWKNVLIDRNFTRGLVCRKVLFDDKNGQLIRLLENRQIHMVTSNGYITRKTFFALLKLLNQHYVLKNKESDFTS